MNSGPWHRRKPFPHKCLICNHSFLSKSPKAKYCSNSCKCRAVSIEKRREWDRNRHRRFIKKYGMSRNAYLAKNPGASTKTVERKATPKEVLWRRYRRNNLEKVRVRGRVWARNNREYCRENGKIQYHKNPKKSYLAVKASREKFPQKLRARQVLRLAILSGEIVRPSKCDRCHAHCIPDGHHPNYNKPLEVIWLCDPCHGREHRRYS